jgi:tetratricopeptide (TPR) repeat protein
MGRSLSPVTGDDVEAARRNSGKVLFEAGGLEYSIEEQGGHLVHREARRGFSGGLVAQNSADVQFTLGSGRQAQAYLIERDGFLFLSPITRYVRTGRWDLSPGYEKKNLHFGRPIVRGCLFCHSNRVEPVAGTVNRYRPPIFRGHAIGCERCHGPGELHVERPVVVDGRDVTIVNPASLEPALRDAVCEQCHLTGHQRIERLGRQNEDFRPGLPFHKFWTVLAAIDSGETRFVGQVEQMHESRCFRASRGRLGCISCHDPHRLPKAGEEAAYYRGRCLECHADRGCSLPPPSRKAADREDDCVACHMPRLRSSDVFHGATTDHRVPRAADADRPPVAETRTRDGNDRLVFFHRELMDERDLDAAGRELGVALARSYAWPESAARALPLLDAALATRPDDVLAWECKGVALGRLGRHGKSQAAFREALAREPDRESTLAEAAEYAAGAGKSEDAIALWRRVMAISPWRATYHAEFAAALFQARDWREAAEECRVALRLNSADLAVRRLLIRCELRLKDQDAASRELRTLLEFDPPDRAELIRRFGPASRDRAVDP